MSKLPKYAINLTGSPNSTVIKIKKMKFKAVVDSSAEVSLIHSRVFVSLKDKPKVFKRKVHLQSVSGKALNIEGCANITIKIGKTEVTQLFYIVKDMNRNVILGKD